MSVNIYDSNTGQLQKIAGLLENENIGVPKAGTYTSDNSSNADNIKALDTALVNINQAVSNVADNIADDNDEYNPNHNYVVGEYCISPDDGSLQKCVVATSGGSWATVKDTCFTKDSLTNVVKTLNNDLTPVTSQKATISNGTGTIYIYKFGHVGIITVDITPSDANTTTITLPSGYTFDQHFYDKREINNVLIYCFGYKNDTSFKVHHQGSTAPVLVTIPVTFK